MLMVAFSSGAASMAVDAQKMETLFERLQLKTWNMKHEFKKAQTKIWQ